MMIRAMTPQDFVEVSRSPAFPRPCSDTKGIIAIRAGRPLAFCILDSWTRGSVQAHLHIDNPIVIKHGFLHEVAQYVFVTAERHAIIGLVPEDFDWAIKFNRKIGFKELCTVPNAYDVGIGYVIMHMDRESGARWLEESPHGRKERQSSAA